MLSNFAQVKISLKTTSQRLGYANVFELHFEMYVAAFACSYLQQLKYTKSFARIIINFYNFSARWEGAAIASGRGCNQTITGIG